MDPEKIRLVSIVIPVYNESASLSELWRRLTQMTAQLPCEHEIIFVDDGSHDHSATLLRDYAKQPENAAVAVLLNRNYGQHAAIMAGFQYCQGDFIITLDADLQNPPEEIPRLIEAAQKGYDVVATVRLNRQDSFLRRLASKIINRAARQSTGVSMSDYGCMLRGYRRRIVNAMLACHERSTFIPILANSFAHSTTEIPVAHAEREYGKSRYGVMKLVNLMFDLVTSMTTAPLRLLSILGSIIAACGFVFATLLIALRLFLGASWAGEGVFTILAILFVFVGAQFLGLGLLGEYIGRIYADVRARPRYFVEEVISTRNTPVLHSSDY